MRLVFSILLLPLVGLGQGFSDASAPFLLSTSPLRKGLVGYWRLEGGAPTWKDESSTGANLTSVNSVTTAAGVQTLCGVFKSSSSQHLDASSSNVLQFHLSQPFTCALWAKLTNNGTSQALVGHTSSDGNRGWLYLAAQGKQWIQLVSGAASSRSIRGTANPTNEVWNLLTATYDGSGTVGGFHLFFNGAVDTTSGSSTPGSMTDIDNTGLFVIGAYTGGLPANGLIDEVGLWNRVLTDNEITNKLYQAGRGTHFPWAHP